jgi:hypothetical protein
MERTEVTDYLEELTKEQLDSTLPHFLEVIEKLEELRILLGSDHLYTQRTIGLARGTKKEDPLDCAFVLRAIREMLTTNKKDLKDIKHLIRWLDSELNE